MLLLKPSQLCDAFKRGKDIGPTITLANKANQRARHVLRNKVPPCTSLINTIFQRECLECESDLSRAARTNPGDT
jgi:hypothetical protein